MDRSSLTEWRFLISLVLASSLWRLVELPASCQAVGQGNDPKVSLEQAYRSFHGALLAGNRQESEKAARLLLADQKDIEKLFPKNADRLWPLIKVENQNVLKDIGEMEEQVARHGPITEIRVINVREHRQFAEYMDVLEIIPKDALVCELAIKWQKGSGGAKGFVHVNGRWVIISEFSSLLERARKADPK